MVLVQKANRVISISELDVETYINQGYNVVDENGKVLKKSAPTNIDELKAELDAQKVLVIELENENKKLKDEIKKLKSANNEPVVSENAEPEAKPKRSAKTSK